MATLRLNPEAAAARRAARAASGMPEQAIVAPEPPRASRGGTLSNKHDRLKAELDALEQKLRRIWPHCFTEPVPLKIGIRFDIAPHLDETEQKLLPGVLHRWVKRKPYLRACLQPGSHRVDLQGNLTPVSEKDRAFASKKVGAVNPPPPVEVAKP